MLRQKAGARDGLQVLNPLHVDGAKPAQRPPVIETDAEAVLAGWRSDDDADAESEPEAKAS